MTKNSRLGTEDWKKLKEIYASLPERTKEGRKTILDIAGYPSWETVNSNFLQFYLLENEEHGFGRLFFDSLLEIIAKKSAEEGIEFETNDYDGSYVVDREVYTGSKYIDLVIQEDVEDVSTLSWAIIIENKMNASLYNDLENYYNHVKADKKCLVVVSLREEKVDASQNYLNVTHAEWVNRIKSNLGNYYFASDDRHLLYLKDYIQNIESFYNKKNDMENNEVLRNFQENKALVQKLKNEDGRMLKFVYDTLSNVLSEKGYKLPSSSKGYSSKRHFYFKKEEENKEEEYLARLKVLGLEKNETTFHLKRFRFWIDMDALKYDNAVLAYFELWDKSFLHLGEEVQKALRKLGMLENGKGEGVHEGKHKGKNHCHIYYLWLPLGKEGDLETRLRDKLNDSFFSHKNNYLKVAVEALEAAVKNASTKK